MINRETPDADGNVGKDRWDAYVQCAIDGLMIWERY
jgi:hypothetical protein